MIPIFEPWLGPKAADYIQDCVGTRWVSSQGAYVERFEALMADYHGVPHAVATSNCTTALHLALAALDIGPGDEVLCPAHTFISPANMIRLTGADCVLVDIDPTTLCMDPGAASKAITERSKAMIVVHQFGHPADMEPLLALARQHDLRVIEDNAESMGARYRGQLSGTMGDAACFSFFGNKIMTTGEGGAVLTRDDDLADRLRLLRDHGMRKDGQYRHEALGFNYRMTNLQAALGLSQLEVLDEILERRWRQWEHYVERLQGLPGLELRQFADCCDPVHWLATIFWPDAAIRDALLDFMHEREIECRRMVRPVHHATHFADAYPETSFPNANAAAARGAHLPSSLLLSESQLEHICDSVQSFANNHE